MTSARAPHIVLLDLYASGHHRSYLEMLVDYWLSTKAQGRLTLFLTSDFDRVHSDFVKRVRDLEGANVFHVSFDTDLDVSSGGIRALWKSSREHTRAAHHVLENVAPDHLLFMYFDHAQLAVPALTSASLKGGTLLSGIFFRPTFHIENEDLKSRLTGLRKRLVARYSLRSNALHRLYCLDPYVVDPLNRRLRPGRRDVAVYLPDGVSRPRPLHERATQRARWDCNEDDIVYLFFGSIEPRKGILNLLDALRQPSQRLRDRAIFVIAGHIPEVWREEIHSRIDSLAGMLRIQVDDRYIGNAEMASFFNACDVVLAPYVGHVGSSNVVIRAAAAGKPVIGPAEGLVGRQVRDHGLGLSVDTRDPAAIHEALVRGLQDASALFDRDGSQQFADRNTPDSYARTIFSELRSGQTGSQSS